MSATKTVKQLVHKIDHLVLTVIGENKSSQKKLIVPKQFTATELRRSFITDYAKAQPSLLRVTLLKLYVTPRHLIGSLAKRVLRKSRGIS